MARTTANFTGREDNDNIEAIVDPNGGRTECGRHRRSPPGCVWSRIRPGPCFLRRSGVSCNRSRSRPVPRTAYRTAGRFRQLPARSVHHASTTSDTPWRGSRKRRVASPRTTAAEGGDPASVANSAAAWSASYCFSSGAIGDPRRCRQSSHPEVDYGFRAGHVVIVVVPDHHCGLSFVDIDAGKRAHIRRTTDAAGWTPANDVVERHGRRTVGLNPLAAHEAEHAQHVHLA